MSRMSTARPYHHGDLRRVVLDAAVAALLETGPGGLSLRDLARRAGVSHAAPAYHFGDKAGLLTAIAAEGFDLLADALTAAHGDAGGFLEVGVAYVRFAIDHRAHFEVMYRPDLLRGDDPALVTARDATAALLYGPVGTVADMRAGEDPRAPAVAAWSLVHGLATLVLTGNLPGELTSDPEALTRAVARHLFPATRPAG
jgi:AcrR family transcriptional regulator